VWADNEPLAQIQHRPALATEELAYLHTDHLQTPRLATDATMAVVWRFESEAFGTGKPDTDPDGDETKTQVRLRFAGQYRDGESGLHYNWHRYYDPKIGRYVTSDPIGLMGGLNTYTYVLNNPLRYTDPRGLDVVDGWEPSGPIGSDPINWGWRYDNWYGNWCGPGGAGRTISGVDCACKRHDKCYEDCGLDAKKRWLTRPGLGSGCALKCDTELANNPSRNDCGQCNKQ